jgi:hypothetical protein
MSKKDFTGGINSLLGDQPEQPKGEIPVAQDQGRPKRGRPVTQTKEITKSSQEGTKENETRATFIINEELLEKLKAIAYWDRLLIKDVVNTALNEAIMAYEKKNGVIKPIPKK